MAKSIEKRIEAIEDSLQLKKAPHQFIVILGCRGEKNLVDTFGDSQQWASYKQYKELHQDDDFLAFYPDSALELIARQRPLTPDELAALDFNGW